MNRGRAASRASSVMAATLLATGGCAVTLPVRTIPAGETRVVGSLAEPLASHLPSFGVPYITAGILHGTTDATTISADLHALLVATGVVGVDLGLAHRLGHQHGVVPELTAEAQVGLFYGAGGGRAFPATTVTASWNAGAHALVYTGANLTAQLVGAPTLFVSPSLGVQRDFGRRWVGQLEWRILGANVDTESGLLEGTASFAGHGGMVLQLGAQWRTH